MLRRRKNATTPPRSQPRRWKCSMNIRPAGMRSILALNFPNSFGMMVKSNNAPLYGQEGVFREQPSPRGFLDPLSKQFLVILGAIDESFLFISFHTYQPP